MRYQLMTLAKTTMIAKSVAKIVADNEINSVVQLQAVLDMMLRDAARNELREAQLKLQHLKMNIEDVAPEVLKEIEDLT